MARRQTTQLWAWVYLLFQTAWFRLMYFLFEEHRQPLFDHSGDTRHKVAVVGDSLAAGFGDYLTFGAKPGVVGRLRKLLVGARKPKHGVTGPTVRHVWDFLNLGAPSQPVCSCQWLSPENYARVYRDSIRHGAPPRAGESSRAYVQRVAHERTRLWQQFCDEKNRFFPRDSEVVILCLGTLDDECECASSFGKGSRSSAGRQIAQQRGGGSATTTGRGQRREIGLTPIETRENLQLIVRQFLDRGTMPRLQKLLVCTTPAKTDAVRTSESSKSAHERRNKLIHELIDVVRTKWDDDRVILGADLGYITFGRDPLYCYDQAHFSSKGYKMFAEKLWDVLVPVLCGVEFQYWRSLFTGPKRHSGTGSESRSSNGDSQVATTRKRAKKNGNKGAPTEDDA